MSSAAQGHQILSLSTVSALKPTLCVSAIVFSVNVGSARVFKTGLRSTKPDNLLDVSAFRIQSRIQSGVLCPSVIVLPHCPCVN